MLILWVFWRMTEFCYLEMFLVSLFLADLPCSQCLFFFCWKFRLNGIHLVLTRWNCRSLTLGAEMITIMALRRSHTSGNFWGNRLFPWSISSLTSRPWCKRQPMPCYRWWTSCLWYAAINYWCKNIWRWLCCEIITQMLQETIFFLCLHILEQSKVSVISLSIAFGVICRLRPLLCHSTRQSLAGEHLRSGEGGIFSTLFHR